MNDVFTLVERARALGARVWTDDGLSLKVDAPADFPDEMVEELRAAKERLLEALRTTPAYPGGTLLAWAAQLAERGLVLDEPIPFHEAPLRPVRITHVSRYAGGRIRTVLSARVNQDTEGWSYFTPAWWMRQEREALIALSALRCAMERDS